jgi:hypothetical protein
MRGSRPTLKLSGYKIDVDSNDAVVTLGGIVKTEALRAATQSITFVATASHHQGSPETKWMHDNREGRTRASSTRSTRSIARASSRRRGPAERYRQSTSLLTASCGANVTFQRLQKSSSLRRRHSMTGAVDHLSRRDGFALRAGVSFFVWSKYTAREINPRE